RLHETNGQVRDEITFDADGLFPMASTVKVPIAMLAARRIGNGELSLDEEIKIDSSLLSPGLPHTRLDHLFFAPFKTIRPETIDRLLGFMLHYSDNTATDVLLQKLGGVPAVAAFLNELSIREMRFKRTAGHLVDHYFGLK